MELQPVAIASDQRAAAVISGMVTETKQLSSPNGVQLQSSVGGRLVSTNPPDVYLSATEEVD